MIDIRWHAIAQRLAKVDVQFRAKAHVNLTIGGEPDAVAMVAEIVAHGRNKSKPKPQSIYAPVTGRASAFMRQRMKVISRAKWYGKIVQRNVALFAFRYAST